MKTISINFHSFVDIITNSSTVIYTYVGNVDAVKEFINEILAGVDADVTADDLYEFKVALADSAAEGIVDNILDDEDEDNPHYRALKKINDLDLGWRDKNKAFAEYVSANIPVEDAPENWQGFPAEEQLLLIPKLENTRKDLGALLEKVFRHDGAYDG